MASKRRKHRIATTTYKIPSILPFLKKKDKNPNLSKCLYMRDKHIYIFPDIRAHIHTQMLCKHIYVCKPTHIYTHTNPDTCSYMNHIQILIKSSRFLYIYIENN